MGTEGTPGGVVVRSETQADVAGIRAVHEITFSGSAEAVLTDRLRDGGAMLHSVVATHRGSIIGHAAFSRGLVDDAVPITTVGPVAVLPEWQGVGVGTELMRYGIAACQADGEIALFLLGDPRYYGRFGFDVAVAAPFTSPYAGPYFQVLSLRPGALPAGGAVTYPAAFAELP